MARLMPRSLRYSIVLGTLLLMGALVSAPAAGAIPADYDPPLPTPPPSTPLPDLVVESFDYGYAGPYLGWYTEATIRNQSNQDIFSSFYVRDDYSWNKTVRVNGLAAGSHVRVRFYRYDCESRGTVVADAFRQIQESNEYNNSRTWYYVC